MSRKQTRRSISVSGETYDRLRAHAAANGTTGSGVVEDLLRGFFEMPEREQKEKIAPIPRFERKPPTPKAERVMVLTTPELGPEVAWVEKGPADRVQVIKDAHEFKQAFEKKEDDSPKKKEGVILRGVNEDSPSFYEVMLEAEYQRRFSERHRLQDFDPCLPQE